MRIIAALTLVGIVSLPAANVDSSKRFSDATPLEWSQRLARSELARRGNSLEFGSTPKARWDYTAGLFAFSLQQLAARVYEPALAASAARIVESYIADDGSIRTYRPEEFNLDNITPGRALLVRYEQTHEPRLKIAIERLRTQLAQQPRTSDGGFWHKQRYPYQMWLDGLYMSAPFYADYGRVFGDRAAFDDVVKQIRLIDAHLHDPATGLYYHAWDEKRAQSWADKETGHSPNFWGRAIGWYAMAVVDVLDDLPPTHPDAEAINEIFHRIADGIVRWQDPQSGVWWQIVDQPGRTGNYLEASASSMLVYALAKGVNRGYLPREKFLPAIERGYAGLVREFVRTEPDGSVNLTRICEVAGLNYTSASGRARDGSFDYYVSEPVVENDLKGVGPFILAGIEVEPALSGAAPKRSAVARGWSDVPAILARIKSPDFPARDFSIADFGAVPGGDATGAIKAAIATCHAAGGGRVVVPAGEWRTGAIHLKSRVNLHVAKGATLRFSTEPSDYLPVVMTRWEGIECMNYSPLIYAFEQEDVAVTGEGTLDGGASDANWWAWKAGRQKPGRELLNQMGERGTPVAERVLGEGKFLRPNFIQFYRCRGGLVEGVTIVRSPMWEIHPVLSTNVTVRGVKIDSHGPNNDGCDPESCRDVLIEDCTFDTGDDCIAIKSGRNNDGRRVATPSENIIVRRCVMKDGHGGVVLGSEISGDVRNVFVEDCAMDSPNLDRALRFKSNAVRGGVVEGVFMRNVKIGRVSEAVLTVDFLYEEGSTGSFKPIVRQVQLDHIVSESSPRLLFLRGFDGATIDDLRINDSVINGVTEPDVVQFVGTVTLRNVTLNPAKKTGGSPSALPVAH